MSKSIVLYADGAGSSTKCEEKRWPLAWGVVALHDDQMVEFSGYRPAPMHLIGAFEVTGFIEAMLYAVAKGFAFEAMSFYVDDAAVAYAQNWLHPENYYIGRAAGFLGRLKELTRHFYSETVFDMALECFKRARFVKVKSHRHCVYNNRVDYLARRNLQAALGQDRVQIEPYEAWLHEGFEFVYHKDGVLEKEIWYAPFVNISG